MALLFGCSGCFIGWRKLVISFAVHLVQVINNTRVRRLRYFCIFYQSRNMVYRSYMNTNGGTRWGQTKSLCQNIFSRHINHFAGESVSLREHPLEILRRSKCVSQRAKSIFWIFTFPCSIGKFHAIERDICINWICSQSLAVFDFQVE